MSVLTSVKAQADSVIPKLYFSFPFLQNSFVTVTAKSIQPSSFWHFPNRILVDSVCDDHTTYDTRPLKTEHETHEEQLQPYCEVCLDTNHEHLLLVGGANTYSNSSFLQLIILFKYLRITVATLTIDCHRVLYCVDWLLSFCIKGKND